MFVYF